MSIVTKSGDDGETSLLFGERVLKTDPRIEAVGAVDELNTALGVVRVSGGRERTVAALDQIQERLVGLMGELGIRACDAERYAAKGYAVLEEAHVGELDDAARALEERGLDFDGWARPGAAGSAAAAHLDVARTVCRRAERRVLELGDGLSNPLIPIFLNRLSDVLWLLARDEETR